MNRGAPERSPVLTTCGFVRNNCLCIFGAYDAGLGGIPFAKTVNINGEVPDGPVNMGSPTPAVAEAINEVRGSIMNSLQAKSVERGAASLVERARCGDQVAMGILVELGRAAKSGNQRAAKAARDVQRYIEEHPPMARMAGESVGIDADAKTSGALWSGMRTEDDLQYSAVVVALVPCIQCAERSITMLSLGPDIWQDAERLGALAACFGAEEHKVAFGIGVANAGNADALVSFGAEMEPDELMAMHIGHCVGLARRIQGARRPDTSIGVLSKMAAWELE